MGNVDTAAHDPSVREDADTSPRCAQGGRGGPRYLSLYEINTRLWLHRLSRGAGRPIHIPPHRGVRDGEVAAKRPEGSWAT